MKRDKVKFSMPRAAAVAVLIGILLVGTLTAAFAADLGGIRQAATIWIQGKPREALVSMGEGEVIVEIGEGETHSFRCGGVALDDDGTQRPITAEELIDYLNEPSVDVTRDGRLIASWYDQAEDISDRFEDGVCRVSLEHDGKTVYMIVRLNGDGGYSVSCGDESFEALEAELAEAARLEAEMEDEVDVEVRAERP